MKNLYKILALGLAILMVSGILAVNIWAATNDQYDLKPKEDLTTAPKEDPRTPTDEAHDVIVYDAENGTVSADKTTAKKGDTVTLKIAPDDGYEVDKVAVVDDGASNVRLAGNQFTMPDKDVYVTVTFKPIGTPVTKRLIASVIGAHGTVSPTSGILNKNDVVTLIFNPDPGYEIDAVRVNDVKVEVSENVLNLEMYKDQYVTVQFKQIKTPTPPTPSEPSETKVDEVKKDDKVEEKPEEKPEEKKDDRPEEKTEEKTETKPETIERKVILTLGSKTLDKQVNGVDSLTQMDVAAYAKDGRTMLPIRFVAEALCMGVTWDGKTRTVFIEDDMFKIEIPVDTNKIIVNGKVMESDVMPEFVNGRTMLPIANIARALGLKDGEDIFWDSATKQVTIIRTISK